MNVRSNQLNRALALEVFLHHIALTDRTRMRIVKDNPGTGLIGRRRFLRETLFGTAALGAAPLLPSLAMRGEVPQEIARRLEFFSEGEYLVVSAVAERLIGNVPGESSPEDRIDAALRADQFLSGEDPEIQDQIHLLLSVFNSAITAILFDFKFSRFLTMNAADQGSYLEGWMTSSIGFRRTGFQALKRLCMSIYYTDARSWEAIGYQGMLLSGATR
jgi:hypothetical protein